MSYNMPIPLELMYGSLEEGENHKKYLVSIKKFHYMDLRPNKNLIRKYKQDFDTHTMESDLEFAEDLLDEVKVSKFKTGMAKIKSVLSLKQRTKDYCPRPKVCKPR